MGDGDDEEVAAAWDWGGLGRGGWAGGYELAFGEGDVAFGADRDNEMFPVGWLSRSSTPGGCELT